MQTGINIDYKYFAGIRDPIEILNKYRTRGYGIILNDREKQHMAYYNANLTTNMKQMYNINIRNKESIANFFGSQNINSNIFKPLVYSKDMPANNYNTNNIKPIRMFVGNSDVMDYMRFKKKCYNPLGAIDSMKLRSINYNGKIEPVKKWAIQAIYDQEYQEY
jgi:hypothetical protein